MEKSLYRTYAAVDLSAIRHNYETVRSQLHPKCKILSVIKADGYGHGAVSVANTLSDSDYFGVACINEALDLREKGIKKPILILGYTSPREATKLAEFHITQCVFDASYAQELQQSLLPGQTLTVHVKIDTGMSRLGFYAHDSKSAREAANAVAESISKTPNLSYEGIFTHFTSSETEDPTETQEQFTCFMKVIECLEEKGISFALRHCANSAAVFKHPQTHLDMVRPGIVLYGYSPDPENSFGLKPALELKAYISQVHHLKPGDPVSYNRTFRATNEMKIATVCIGYGDGLHRALSNGAPVLLNGRKTKILGRICMDQCIIDATDIPVQSGDIITLIGTDGEETLTATELANYEQTIHYEILCSIGKRIPRIYK